MVTHVGKHTPQFCCKQCAKVYPMERALKRHQPLHGAHTEHHCADCDQVYATLSSLTLHHCGKHGTGFLCACGHHFDSPTQRV